MIIVLEKYAANGQINDVIKKVEDYGFSRHKSNCDEQVIFGVAGLNQISKPEK